MNSRLLKFLCLFLGILSLGSTGNIWGQGVSLTTLGSAYTQNFNTLSNTAASTTNNLTITGWFLTEIGGGTRDNEQYGVDTGGSNTGDMYSYGAAGSTDRALGSLQSGTLIPIFGAAFTNNTGSTITSLDINYYGEQWRFGAIGRTDQLNFHYSLNATDLGTGTWMGVDALNFITPDVGGTGGARDGNAASARTYKSAVLSGLNIPDGTTFWIRWTDTNAAAADDGLAVDDFSLTPTNVPVLPSLSVNDVSLAEGNIGTTTFNFTVSLSAPAGPGGVTFDIATADNTATQADNDYITRSLTGQTIPAGSSTYDFSVQVNGDITAEANQTFFVNVTNVVGVNVSDGQGTGTIVNDDVTLTPIHDIQGPSGSSPIEGASVTTSGIVTALRNNGFYLQNPNPDADDATSEGVFIFTNSAPTVAVGHAVQVSGTVTEFRATSTNLTLTELTSPTITVLSTGNSLPPATVLGIGGRTIPTTIISDGISFYESLEGMLVHIHNPVAVSPTNNFGEIWLLADNGANASLRTARGGIVVQSNDFNPERIQIDNELLGAAVMPTVNVGAQLSNLVGVVDYSFGNYEVLPTTAPTVVSPSTLGKEVVSPTGNTNKLTLGTFNVENLDPGDGAAKFNSLATAIVTNLQSPDILVLEEVQDNNGPTNDGTVDATTTYQTLINAIQVAGGPTYQFRQIDPSNVQDGGEPGGNIRQGFLFNPSRVNFVDRPGGSATASTTVSNVDGQPVLSSSPGRIDPTNLAFTSSRKPLAGEFLFNGQTVIVIGNHFNSKGGDQPLFGGNQPPVLSSEVQRTQQAVVVRDFVQSVLAINPNANVVVAGDLNDFEFSTPLNTLKNGGLNALIETLPANERYTYNFEGNAQALDHVLVSNNLLGKLDVFDVAHINSEFADQISDHDPSVAVFNFTPALSAALVANPSAVCSGSPVSFSLTIVGLGAGQTFSYEITNGTNSITAAGVSATAVQTSLVPTVPGSFTATVLTTGNVSATATSENVTINELPTNVSLTGGTLTCAQTSVTLTASSTGGSSYSLSDGQSNTTGQFVVSAPGDYTVVVSNVSGCTAAASTNVGSNTTPPAVSTVASSTSISAGQSVTLTASGGTSYLWSTGVSGSILSVIPPAGTTVYSVTVTNAVGCFAIASVSISSAQVVGPAALCVKSTPPANTEVTLPLSMTIVGGSSSYTYSWSYKAPKSANYKDIPAKGTTIGKISMVPVGGAPSINLVGTKGNLNGLQGYLIRLTVLLNNQVIGIAETLLDGSCPLVSSNARQGVTSGEIVQVRVHPNPVTDVLQVEIRGLSQPAKVGLYDLQGRPRGQWSVEPVEGVGQLKAPVSNLAEGLYLLQVETAEGVLSRQRVLKR